jgi:hypothetical protein
MKIAIVQNNETLLELNSEGMSSEQMESSENELRGLLTDKEVLEWNLKFKEGTSSNVLNDIESLGEFITEQIVTIK